MATTDMRGTVFQHRGRLADVVARMCVPLMCA
jgi:hypothetical protein